MLIRDLDRDKDGQFKFEEFRDNMNALLEQKSQLAIEQEEQQNQDRRPSLTTIEEQFTQLVGSDERSEFQQAPQGEEDEMEAMMAHVNDRGRSAGGDKQNVLLTFDSFVGAQAALSPVGQKPQLIPKTRQLM